MAGMLQAWLYCPYKLCLCCRVYCSHRGDQSAIIPAAVLLNCLHNAQLFTHTDCCILCCCWCCCAAGGSDSDDSGSGDESDDDYDSEETGEEESEEGGEDDSSTDKED